MKRLVFILIPVLVIAALLILIVLASNEDDNGNGDAEQAQATTAPADESPTTEPATEAETEPEAEEDAEPDTANGDEASGKTEDDAEPEAENGGDSSGETEAESAGEGPRALAWEYSANRARLLQLRAGALPQELFVFPNAGRIQPCSHAYRQAGENGVILFVGNERGDLVYYPLADREPVTLGQTHRLTCAGPDTLQVFPGGERIAYLRFRDDVLNRPYRTGTLVITDLAHNEIGALENTTAFQISGSDIISLNFYPDGEGNAAEADVQLWAADGTVQNIVTLVPQMPENTDNAACAFEGGDIARQQETVYALLGEYCQPGGTRWRLVAIEDGTLTEIASGETGGSFYPDNFSAQVWPATDGSAVLVAVPSGLQRHIVTLLWVLPDGSTREVAEFARADRLGTQDLEARQLLRSPDGRWLAFLKVTRDNVPALWVLDLDNPTQDPQELAAAQRNETIYDYKWGPGRRLYYIAGHDEVNALFVAIPGTPPERIARGRFVSLVPDARGERVVAVEVVDDPDSAVQTFREVVLIALDGTRMVLWQSDTPNADLLALGVE